MEVEIGNGELFDKVSILQIKQERGLPVEKELDVLQNTIAGLLTETMQHPFNVLKQINRELWIIEDNKRAYEKTKNFDENFVALSRLVYLLNDERARVKRLIDNLTLSNIVEYKKPNGEQSND